MQQYKNNTKKMIFKKNLNILLYNMLSQETFNYHQVQLMYIHFYSNAMKHDIEPKIAN